MLSLAACSRAPADSKKTPPPPRASAAKFGAAPTGVDGRVWGSAPTPDLKAYAGPLTNGVATYAPRSAQPTFDGLRPIKSDFSFGASGLSGADLYFKGAGALDRARAALTAHHGPAQMANDEAHIYRWDWPADHVRIVAFGDDHDTMVQVTKTAK